MSHRIRVQASPLTMDDVIRITGEIAQASHELRVETEKLNKRIDALKATCEEAHKARANEINDKTQQLSRWAAANPSLFKKNRSIDLPRASIGFRLGHPSVKLIKNVEVSVAVAALLKLRNGERFVTRPEPKLNKPNIIAMRTVMKKHFEECGIVISQTDRFYVEPKAEAPLGVVEP